jgi:hypothetical protein
MLSASRFHTKQQSSRNNPSAQVLEDVSWDRYTFKLPALLPNAATAPPSIKERYYRGVLEGVAAAQQASALTKLNVLASRFEYPHLTHEIDGSLQRLYDNTSGSDSRIDVITDPTIFSFGRPSVRNEQGQEINIPQPGVAALPANLRRQSKFYSFQLTVHPREAYEGPEAVRDSAGLESSLFNVAIAFPLDSINDANNVDNGYDVLPPALTATVLRSVPQTLQALAQLDNGNHPILGILSKPAGQFLVSIKPSTFRSEFMEYFHQCRYKLFRELLRSEFLGRSLVDSSSIINELQSFRQNRWDPKAQRMDIHTVEEYYGSFTAAVNLLPYNQLYPVDIAMLFWNGLTADIRQQGESVDPPYTPPSRPQGQVESNQQADTRLRAVKDAAVRFEKQLDNVKTQVNRARGMWQGRSQPRAFVGMPFYNNPFVHEVDDSSLPGFTDNAYNISHDGDPFDADPCTQPPQMFSNADPLMAASVYLSVAEEAIQKATGTNLPLLECWGCTNHPKHHEQRFHRWIECPYRGDQSVQALAKKGLQQFLEKRRSTRQQRSNRSDQWQASGYPNQQVAQIIASIASPNTLPSQRQAYIHYLSSLNSNQPDKVETSNLNAAVTEEQDSKPTASQPFLSFPVRVLTALKPEFDAKINLSQVMPHINMPIGPASRSATLSCMVDSCAGLSIGRLGYHRSIYERHPELVLKWTFLGESTNMDEFTIGGIDAKGEPTKVVAMVTYFTPFKVNGQSVSIHFALAEDVAANSILGLPFLRSSGSSILLDHDTLIAQKFGSTFKIFYQVPVQAEIAPVSGIGSPAAFPALVDTPSAITNHIERCGKQLSAAFAITELATSPTVNGWLLRNPDLNQVYTDADDGDEWFCGSDS